MPFTPFHMGPGVLVKALLQGSFSLMLFGWTQIVMDLQPLIAIVTGEGKLHGFTHTYVGSTLIAVLAAVTGKYISQWALIIFTNGAQRGMNIRWWVAFLSAFIGSYSHVILDSIMHTDMEPLLPFAQSNGLLGLISIEALHKLCIYSGLLGTVIYFAFSYLLTRRNKPFN